MPQPHLPGAGLPSRMADLLRPLLRVDTRREPPGSVYSPRLIWLFSVACYLPLTAVGFLSYDPEHLESAVWSSPMSAVIMFMMCCTPGRGRPARFLISVAVLGGCLFLGGFAFTSPRHLLLMWVAQVASAAVLAFGYAAVAGRPIRYPRRQRDVLAYGGLGVVSAAVLVLLGGVPGAGLGGTGDAAHDLWWIVHVCVGMVYGGPIVIGIHFGSMRPYTTVAYRRAQPFIQLSCLACATLPYSFPWIPLAWLGCLPAVWIGTTLTPRLASLSLIVMLFVPMTVQRSPLTRMSNEGLLPPVVVMETMLIFSGVVALLLLVLRERAARLAALVNEQSARQARHNGVLTGMLETMTDGVLVVDAKGGTVMSTAAWRSLWGRPSGQSGGWVRRYAVLGTDGKELRPETVQSLERPADTRDPQVRVTLPAPGKQSDRVLAVTASALLNRGRTLTLVVSSDVTAAHARRQALEGFAGTVAHDLKNPLTSLALWIDVAESELALDPVSGREALAKAREAGSRMRDIIDEYLAYTVTREGMLRPQALRLDELARQVCAEHAQSARLQVEVDAPVSVRADPALTRQVLANLVSNAVKYARPGEGAFVRVRSIPDEEHGWVRILVEDRGIGIGPEERETIFAPFARTARGAATSYGVGLGLALCQDVIVRHGGRISASGNHWGGTTIEFTLPLAHDLVPPRTTVP